jgi:hypothetical protein
MFGFIRGSLVSSEHKSIQFRDIAESRSIVEFKQFRSSSANFIEVETFGYRLTPD